MKKAESIPTHDDIVKSVQATMGRGFTAREIANEAGVHESTLSRLLADSGRRTSFEVARKIWIAANKL